jgi:peroxiredoxin
MFAAGDTAAAARMLARVAVDPSTRAMDVDSLRRPLGPSIDSRLWDALVINARLEMMSRTLGASVTRTVDESLRLADSTGRARALRDLRGDGAALVLFWSRNCSPSLRELEQLQRLLPALDSLGVRLLAITADPPSVPLRAFLTARGLRLPVLHDVNGDVARMFDHWATPAYWIVDARGRIRFDHTSLADVPRQIAALTDELAR